MRLLQENFPDTSSKGVRSPIRQSRSCGSAAGWFSACRWLCHASASPISLWPSSSWRPVAAGVLPHRAADRGGVGGGGGRCRGPRRPRRPHDLQLVGRPGVTLHAAGNEVVAVQLLVRAGDPGIRELRRPADPHRARGAPRLLPPAGEPSDFRGRPIQVFSVGYMKIERASRASFIYPPGGRAAPADPLGWKPVQLIPENARPGRGFPLAVKPRENQALWFENDPGDHPPSGLYRGTITVSAMARPWPSRWRSRSTPSACRTPARSRRCCITRAPSRASTTAAISTPSTTVSPTASGLSWCTATISRAPRPSRPLRRQRLRPRALPGPRRRRRQPDRAGVVLRPRGGLGRPRRRLGPRRRLDRLSR